MAGLPHAFNLIDGYNGLAGIVAIICCFALAYVSLLVGDRQLAGVVLVLAGATAGFLLWNYPFGLIFAGDGGAYLWGVVIAVASVQLVQRYPQVSPWFPALLLIYPVWETVFSIYRKAMRGQSPGVADALHFHQLIYRRIVRGVFDDNEARRMLMRNNRHLALPVGLHGTHRDSGRAVLEQHAGTDGVHRAFHRCPMCGPTSASCASRCRAGCVARRGLP